MKDTRLSIFTLFCFAVLLNGGCGAHRMVSPQNSDTQQTQQLTGADRDTHGCIGSAGYTWSQVQGRCIRLFEEGVQLFSTTDPQATLAAYLVFSADSSRAELFLPAATTQLNRTTSGTYSPAKASEETPTVKRTAQGWKVLVHNAPLYQQSKSVQ